jgi:hypothetical protein
VGAFDGGGSFMAAMIDDDEVAGMDNNEVTAKRGGQGGVHRHNDQIEVMVMVAVAAVALVVAVAAVTMEVAAAAAAAASNKSEH